MSEYQLLLHESVFSVYSSLLLEAGIEISSRVLPLYVQGPEFNPKNSAQSKIKLK